MAQNVNPVVIAHGEVRDVGRKTWRNPETDETESRGRTVLVLTRKGFVQVTVPTEHNSVPFAVGDVVSVYIRISEWSVAGRSGVSYFFDGFAPDAVADALHAVELESSK
jgi:hypothetical protein